MENNQILKDGYSELAKFLEMTENELTEVIYNGTLDLNYGNFKKVEKLVEFYDK